jgi:hypothetical protein
VDRVGKTLVASSGHVDMYDWSFTVINSDEVDAFTMFGTHSQLLLLSSSKVAKFICV